MRLNEIYQTLKGDLPFYCIYIKEAHADNGWRVHENLRDEIHFDEPTTDAERTEVASVCQMTLDLQMPMLIDAIGNDIEEKYVAKPIRLYVVDRLGRIVYAGDQGPRGFDPDSWARAIKAERVKG